MDFTLLSAFADWCIDSQLVFISYVLFKNWGCVLLFRFSQFVFYCYLLCSHLQNQYIVFNILELILIIKFKIIIFFKHPNLFVKCE